MKALFIDFDGVLHPAVGPVGQTLPFEWLPMLAGLLRGEQVGLVVHSSWREQFDADYIYDFVGELAPSLLGIAPPGHKRCAIERFLDANPQIKGAAVMDDDMTGLGHLMDRRGKPVRLIRCDPALGVTDARVQLELRLWLCGLDGLVDHAFVSNDQAHGWLCSPHPCLDGVSPATLLPDRSGADRVRDLLMAMVYGGPV